MLVMKTEKLVKVGARWTEIGWSRTRRLAWFLGRKESVTIGLNDHAIVFAVNVSSRACCRMVVNGAMCGCVKLYVSCSCLLKLFIEEQAYSLYT